MIITRSPLRITLGGGGTDLPSYYRKFEGFVLSAAIDKYVFVSLIRPFTKGIFLKYSEMENVKDILDIKHPIIRETLNHVDGDYSQLEITTLADIPSGTGLGSSGSFTTALIKAIYSYQFKFLSQKDLAEMACRIEIDLLKQPIGKQDQYISTYGGVTCFDFGKDNEVMVKPLNISRKMMHELEDNILLFFTGFSRSANSILEDQNLKSIEGNSTMLNNLHYVKELGYRSKEALEEEKIDLFGEIMNEHWQNKKKRSGGMSNPQIDEWYQLGLKNGAIGGKVVGAGGGGFLLFVSNDRNKLRSAMLNVGLEEVRFKFDFEGTKVIFT